MSLLCSSSLPPTRATRSLASRGTHHHTTVHGRTEECNRCHVQFHRSIRLHVSVNQLFRRNQTATGIFNSRSPGLTQLDERCDRVVKKQGKAAETRMEYTVRPKHLPASSSSRTPGFVVRRPPFLVPSPGRRLQRGRVHFLFLGQNSAVNECF